MGRNTRAKKPRQKTVQITVNELDRQCQGLAREHTKRTALLILTAVSDVLKTTEEQLIDVIDTTALYAAHYDNHLIRMQDLADSIKKNTGLDLTPDEQYKRVNGTKALIRKKPGTNRREITG